MTDPNQQPQMTLRPFKSADWPLIHAIQSDAQHGYWVRGPHVEASESRSRAMAHTLGLHWDAGWGPFLIAMNGAPVGYAGLRRSRLEDAEETEALWGLLSGHHGKGIATRAMTAILGHGLPPGSSSIAAWTLPDNRPSRALMERLGFVYERDATYAELRHVVYRFTP